VKAVSTVGASVAYFARQTFCCVDLKLVGTREKPQNNSHARPERAPVYNQRSSNASFARIPNPTYLMCIAHFNILYDPIGFEPTKFINNILFI
jgi:hypothetical protein